MEFRWVWKQGVAAPVLQVYETTPGGTTVPGTSAEDSAGEDRHVDHRRPTHHIRIPYDAGVASFKLGAAAIAAVDIVLVEVATDAGLTGWGDAWGCRWFVQLDRDRQLRDDRRRPAARGAGAADIPAFMERVQRNLHLFGRYGITMFAISGLDIALWDLAAKAQGAPLHRLLGARQRARIPVYASLLRIGEPAFVAKECEALQRLPGGEAARDNRSGRRGGAAGDRRRGPLMVDMNCPLDGAAAIAFATPPARPRRCSSKSRSGRRIS